MRNKFYKITLLTIFSVIWLGCNFSTGTKTEEKPPEASTESTGINLGDKVVAKWSTNGYYEGLVDGIETDKMKIRWEDGSNPSDIDKKDIYQLPKAGAKPDVKTGDIVLAKTNSSTKWDGAEITAIDGDQYEVKVSGGSSTMKLDAGKIIKVSAETANELKESAGSAAFLNEAYQKKPDMPKNYKPKAGDKVLAQWSTNSWWTGKVNAVNGSQVTIAWDDGSKPTDVEAAYVMPSPTAGTSARPAEKQFVLAKPENGTQWVYARVEKITGADVEITDAKGNKRTVKSGEFVLLK